MKTYLTIIFICVLYCRLHAQVSFTLSSSPSVGTYPLCVAAADVNRDGHLDLISANDGFYGNGNTISVLTNDGTGGFVTANTYVVGSAPYWVAAADFNGDGNVDLVCANSGDNTLSVLTNNGSGSFELSGTYAVGTQPLCVVSADVNGDGYLDLITANGMAHTLTVLTNDGHGGFVLSGTYAVGVTPLRLVAADVNGDGYMDLISANRDDNTLSVLTNNGHGVFQTSATLKVGSSPFTVIAADLNGNGKMDLVSANSGSNTLTVLTNNGFGVFGFNATLTVGSNPYSVAAADVNGDGKMDLVSANTFDSTLTVLTNNGNGGFVQAATLPVGYHPHCIIAVDVNGDGKADLITANEYDFTLSVLTNATPFPSPPPFLTNGLVAYYPLDGNANDASGNGYDATNYNVSWETNRAGVANSAGYFNGASSYILLPAALVNVMSGTNPMAISVWVETSPSATNSGNNNIINIGDPSQNNIFGMLAQYGTFMYSEFEGPYNVYSDVPIGDNSWHQCLASFDGTNIALYVDGVFKIASPVVSNRLNTRGTIGVRVDLGTEYWNGGIDDVRIYNRALSANEVTQLYAYESRSDTNPPSITSQPQPVTVSAGDNASFAVTTTGSPPLNYQWSLNGTNISGATSSSLTISNVSQTDLGEYAVVVSNLFGSTNSSNALLSMYPFIETAFTGAIAYWGKDTTLSVEGWGTGPLHYQWYDNGVAVLNATNQTLFFPSIQFTNAGLYSVVLSSPLGSVTNVPAQVVVNPAGVSIGMSPSVYVSGVVGYTYIIQASSDLTNTNGWATVATLTLIQPVQLWVDISVNALSPTNPHKYYRVVPGG